MTADDFEQLRALAAIGQFLRHGIKRRGIALLTAEELASVRGWLFGKAFTIFGGSQEVQSNIVSKRILGLPDLTQNH